MSNTDKDYMQFLQMLFEYLKEHCIGRELSVNDLVFEAVESKPGSTGYVGTEVCYDLCEVVEKDGEYVMDWDKYAHSYVGMPEEIPFIFRRKRDKHECWEGLVPFFKSGRSYLKWLREGYHDEDCEGAYFEYFRELRQAVDPFGYEQAIPEKEMSKALMRSQVTGEMIDVVPNPEFLPGGERAGQLDGWTYHLEFVTHEEYFKRHPVEEDAE